MIFSIRKLTEKKGIIKCFSILLFTLLVNACEITSPSMDGSATGDKTIIVNSDSISTVKTVVNWTSFTNDTNFAHLLKCFNRGGLPYPDTHTNDQSGDMDKRASLLFKTILAKGQLIHILEDNNNEKSGVFDDADLYTDTIEFKSCILDTNNDFTGKVLFYNKKIIVLEVSGPLFFRGDPAIICTIDSVGKFLNGFISKYHFGNNHGTTTRNTYIDQDLVIKIDEIGDSDQSDGFDFNATYNILPDGKIVRIKSDYKSHESLDPSIFSPQQTETNK